MHDKRCYRYLQELRWVGRAAVMLLEERKAAGRPLPPYAAMLDK